MISLSGGFLPRPQGIEMATKKQKRLTPTEVVLRELSLVSRGNMRTIGEMCQDYPKLSTMTIWRLRKKISIYMSWYTVKGKSDVLTPKQGKAATK
jgi:hypothetical protein